MFNHQSTTRRLFGRVITAVTAFFMTFSAFANDSVIEDILDRDELRVGLSTFEPWAMRAKDGEFIGYEVDVARELAADMGVDLEIVATAWDGIIPALLAEKFDFIIGGMTVTPSRNLQVNFSIPYARSGLGLVANRDLAGDFNTLDDFNSSDVTFALRRGTQAVEFIQNRLPNARILQFDDEVTARQEMLNGNAHAMVSDEPKPTVDARLFPDQLFKPIERSLTASQAGIALRKGDADALNFINNWITIKTENGWLQQRHEYWFASQDWKDQVGE